MSQPVELHSGGQSFGLTSPAVLRSGGAGIAQGEGALSAPPAAYPTAAAVRLAGIFDPVTADALALAGFDVVDWWPVVEPWA